MKYVISENRLVDFVDKYLQNNIGGLRKFPIVHYNAREGDFELVTDRGQTILTYEDYHLAVDKELYNKLLSLFNLENNELEKLLEKWFEKNYPDSMVIGVYPMIE
jgi:hypothetical protein